MRPTDATRRLTGLRGKFAANNESAAAHPGQILIMFAFLLVALLGSLGLAIDLGVAFSQRRTMQAAADAGAYAGARIVAKSAGAAMADVTAVVNSNAMNMGAITSITCEYVNDGGASVGSCSGNPPGGATGVRVAVAEQHNTFFIKVVPGGPATVTTSASARANVQRVTGFSDGPFLPCAKKTQLVKGGTMDLWDDANNKVADAAWGQQFKIHGPQVEKCDIHPSKYKGLADQDANFNLTAPGWFHFDQGNKAGPARFDVQGADGCKAGQDPKNCVMFLPIITNKGQPVPSSSTDAWVVALVPFYITEPNSNEHYGTPIKDYVLGGQEGTGGWDPTWNGPITIRMTE
ncbi:MAG TPA: pilus assembly protein TadG-related protein [Thermomicrobiales bacterium]|nr:pilus assembly protein TadG-related protein [Thermomicrobiales bacterium]